MSNFSSRGVSSGQGHVLSQSLAGLALCSFSIPHHPPPLSSPGFVYQIENSMAIGWGPALGLALCSWYWLENQAGLGEIDYPHWGDLLDCLWVCQ